MSSDAAAWVEAHADALYRYARARVRDAAVAEDLVQETFLAAVRHRDSFAGRSAERTWLVGILRHKLLDHARAEARRARRDLERPDPRVAGLFGPGGRLRARPSGWPGDPARAAEGKEFRALLDACLDDLPPAQRHAVTLRQLDGLSGAEAADALGVTRNHLAVLLHRARLRLWRCLDGHGFRP